MAHNQCIATGPVGAAGTVYVDVGYAAGNCVEAAVTGKLVYGSGGTSIRVRLEGSYDAGATWTPVGDMLFGTASAEKTFIVQSDSTDVFNPGDPLPDNTVRKALPPRLRVSKVVTGTYAGSTLDVWIGLKENAAFKVGQLDTDPAMAANSDARVPSQKAVKTRLDNITSGVSPIALAGIETALGAWGISEKGGGRFNAAHYGASPGATDNIPFINAAIDACYAAGGGEVYLPTHKIFPIKPSGTSNRILLRSGVRLNLGDARLKVADDSPAYQTIITTNGGPSAATSNIHIIGGEIDQNALGHVLSNVSANKQYVFLAYNLAGAVIEDVRFLTCGANTVNINGVECKDIAIRGCHVEFTRGNSEIADYDNSAFYTLAVGTSITDNEFYGTYSAGVRGARGAMEVHAPLGIVRGNRVYNYETLCNICSQGSASIPNVPDQSLVMVSDNVLYGGRIGIRLWPLNGHSLSNVGIRGNQLHIAQVSRNVPSWSGISFTNDSSYRADTIGLDISSNVITFESDTRADASGTEFQASLTGGIILNCLSLLSSASIRDNTIVGSPLRGMQVGQRVTPYEPELRDVVVENNLLTNCGNNRSVAPTLREAFYFRAKLYNNVRVRNNITTVSNADGTAGDQQYLYISDTATGAGNVFVNNTLIVNGGYTLPEVRNDSLFPTNRPKAASTLGTVVKKQEVFDEFGVSLGFIPIYNSIT